MFSQNYYKVCLVVTYICGRVFDYLNCRLLQILIYSVNYHVVLFSNLFQDHLFPVNMSKITLVEKKNNGNNLDLIIFHFISILPSRVKRVINVGNGLRSDFASCALFMTISRKR